MGRKSNRNRKGNVRQTNDADVEVRVVLAYQFSAPATEADLTHEMKRKASSALREEPLQVTRDGGHVVVGNNEGFTLMRKLDELIERLRNPDLYERMVRERFLLTYKRDKLHIANDEDCDMIREVNKKVHGGDAFADARLYNHGNRRDYEVYKKLYGVYPEEIRKIGVEQAVFILDQHATHVAAEHSHCSARFEELFQKYLRNLEAAGYPDDFLFDDACQDPAVAQVRHSYWEFIYCVPTEVRYDRRRSNQ